MRIAILTSVLFIVILGFCSCSIIPNFNGEGGRVSDIEAKAAAATLKATEAAEKAAEIWKEIEKANQQHKEGTLDAVALTKLISELMPKALDAGKAANEFKVESLAWKDAAVQAKEQGVPWWSTLAQTALGVLTTLGVGGPIAVAAYRGVSATLSATQQNLDRKAAEAEAAKASVKKLALAIEDNDTVSGVKSTMALWNDDVLERIVAELQSAQKLRG